MKLQFLGTGAAEGVPAVFCKCKTCEEARKRGGKEIHTRAQTLIDDVVSIDYSGDAYYHSLRFGTDLTKIQYILVTHSHMDHFYAHDFILRGYKYTRTCLPHLTIFGNAEVKKVYDECTKRELKEEVAKNIEMRVVKPFQPFTFGDHGEYTATALLAQHSDKEKAYVYLIEKDEKSYLHLVDTGRLPKETLDYLEKYFQNKRGVDLVTFDCTFLFSTAGEKSRHMGLEDNKEMQMEFSLRKISGRHTRYAITHYSHNNNPLTETLEQAKLSYGFYPTFDGMSVEF